MNILTSTEFFREIAHVIRNNAALVLGIYYLVVLIKSILYYSVVFLLEFPLMKRHKPQYKLEKSMTMNHYDFLIIL